MRTSQGSGERGVRRFNGDEGASLVEYALLLSLIAVVCLSAMVYFQHATTESLSKSSSSITNAGS